MQWIPSEKKKPATELSMESLEEVVEELKKDLKDRGIAIAIKPTKVMFRPLDFENKRRDDAFADFIGGVAYEEDGGWSKEVWDAAWSARRDEVIAEAEKQEPVCDKDPQGCWNVRCQLGKVCKNAHPQPKQEPAASISSQQLFGMFQGLAGTDKNKWGYYWRKGWNDALRQAMDYCTPPSAEKQEPVAWELRKGKTDRVLLEITNDPKRAHDWNCSLEEVVPLYTHPPKQWQGLTDEDIKEIIGYHGDLNANGYARQLFAKIEAKLREKNG